MEDLDGGSYGAGGNQNKRSRKSSQPSKALPETEAVLKEGDEGYPPDVPRGAEKYQMFWTDQLREVTNQGFRRICWAIASSRDLSARLQIEGKAETPLCLSVLHLLVGLFNDTDNKGGLQRLELLREFLKTNGTLLEDECKCVDPFSKAKSKGEFDKSKMKAPPLCTAKGQPPIRTFKVRDLVILENVNEEELIRLVDKAPVAVTVDFYKEFENFSGDGFYNGAKRMSKTVDRHMLLLVGYETSKKQHYWKCQNSAGTAWGDKGYIKILRQVSREKGQPSLFTGVLYPVLLDREAYNPRV